MGVAQFAREYRTVRRAEGWGSPDGAYYRALPYTDLTGRFSGIWRIRARSFDLFVQRVLEPLERSASDADARQSTSALEAEVRKSRPRPTRVWRATTGGTAIADRTPTRAGRALRVLDVGAGSGWLAYRLASRGHAVVALDILDDPLDGLGATRHFAAAFGPLLADFGSLPLANACADLIVFNAALHYSTNYVATLRESLRVLRPRGTLVILDSPMYSDPTSGMRMVQEREARFLGMYGFKSNALPSEHFLTPARLDQLAAELGITWRIYRPQLDWRSALSRTIGGLRARREPARFPVIAGQRR